MALPSNYIDGNVIVDDDGCFTFTVGSSALVAGTFVTLDINAKIAKLNAIADDHGITLSEARQFLEVAA